ncbi:MAG: 5-(carboxyamino)imidazole ribonucleotide synthase [Flavobacteriales bacterium]|jgi:5-(carboxyamino)imidazole ribonucleotide synthase|nr:5-(carboxyamino)imidazole ribonucleotide synthase [Flavobacteriales bacterium]
MDQRQFFSSDFKLGILGGGQLGKMLLYDTIRYDIFTKVMDPDQNATCKSICNEFVVGDLTNYDDVINFCKDVDVVTIEIENVNTDALEYLEKIGKNVYPSSSTLRIIQNKSIQKDFYRTNNLPTSDYKNYSEVSAILEDYKSGNIALPAVWKSAQFGYDGKGVKIVKNLSDLESLPNLDCLIEQKVNIKKEISVIVARNQREERCFPVTEMEFNEDSNLVEYIMCPADISKETEKKALAIAINIAKKINCIGLLAVELFVTDQDEILINEVAPRPHNSGHHTIECCLTSQFDQHVRCILNLPLGSTKIKIPGVMVNLVGENKIEGDVIYKNIEKILDIPGVSTHFYGKKKSRLNRKMGHITVVNKDVNTAIEAGRKIKKTVKVTSIK